MLVFFGGALTNAFDDGNFGLTMSSLVTFVAMVFALAIGVATPALVANIYPNCDGQLAAAHGVARRTGTRGGNGAVQSAHPFRARLPLRIRMRGIVHFRISTNRKGHVAALNVCTTLLLSVLSWITWVPVNAAALRRTPSSE